MYRRGRGEGGGGGGNSLDTYAPSPTLKVWYVHIPQQHDWMRPTSRVFHADTNLIDTLLSGQHANNDRFIQRRVTHVSIK